MDDIEKNKATLKVLNDKYDEILSTYEKYPEELTGNYDSEKLNKEINQRFKVLREEVVDIVDKSNIAKKDHQVYSDKLDESKIVFGRVEELKKLKSSVGTDVEETERNIERIQVLF